MYKSIVLFFLLSFVLFSCKKQCNDFDIMNDFNEVCDIVNAEAVDVPCGESISFEGEEVGVIGKLDPDFLDYLNEYDENTPDTWPSFFRVLDRSAEEGDAITESKFINEKTIQINLYNDGVNASSFVPLKEELEILFKDKAFQTIRIKGIAKSFEMSTNANCETAVLLEINSLDDVEIE